MRAEKDKWPAVGEAMGKKSKQKRAKQGKYVLALFMLCNNIL